MRMKFRPHQKVKVTNPNRQYIMYEDWFKDYNNLELRKYFEAGRTFYPDHYGTFYILGRSVTQQGTEIYAISRDEELGEDSKVYLIDSEGLSKNPSTQGVVQDLADKAYVLYSKLYQILEKEDPENVSSRIDFMTNMDLSHLSNEYKELRAYKMLKALNMSKVELTHQCTLEEWQDYLAYKKIEPEIKGCLDREKALIVENRKLKDSQNEGALRALRKLRWSIGYYDTTEDIKEYLDTMIDNGEKETLYIENKRTIQVLQEFSEAIEENVQFVQDKWLTHNLLRFIDKKIKELKRSNEE